MGTQISWCYCVKYLILSWHYPSILPEFNTSWRFSKEAIWHTLDPSTHIICDQDPAFTLSLMEAFALKLNINIIMVSPSNHKSLQAEHGIKSLLGLLVKHLSEQWNWVSCLSYSTLCYNCYDSPNLDSHSPYKLVFGHKMLISPKLKIQPEVVVSGTFKDYYERLNKDLKYLGERLEKFRSARIDLLNKDRKPHSFQVGQLVYMFQAKGTMVQFLQKNKHLLCEAIGHL